VTNHDNPFIKYRARLDSHRRAMELGWSDDQYVALVEELDAAVESVDGTGFRITPARPYPGIAAELELVTDRVWVKDDTANVGGSHKARHLFGVMLHLGVDSKGSDGELAIASCGNAAVAASVVAAARSRPLRVFIPTWADAAVVHLLERRGAIIEVCERRAGETGDPTYLRFKEAVAAGATPFSVQGSVTPTTLDGGRTIGWELADQLVDSGVVGIVRLFVQIGGGALASSAWMGLTEALGSSNPIEPVLHAVQTEACAPLVRAWDRLTVDLAEREELALPPDRPHRASEIRRIGVVDKIMERATGSPHSFMWPWEVVGTSAASGILDDVTYDWIPVVDGMFRSGGWPVVVAEKQVDRAHRSAHHATGIDVSATGSAGLAGLTDAGTVAALSSSDNLVLLFTGIER
jgi:threonine synthase